MVQFLGYLTHIDYHFMHIEISVSCFLTSLNILTTSNYVVIELLEVGAPP